MQPIRDGDIFSLSLVVALERGSRGWISNRQGMGKLAEGSRHYEKSCRVAPSERYRALARRESLNSMFSDSLIR